jgi:hypothetical protein
VTEYLTHSPCYHARVNAQAKPQIAAADQVHQRLRGHLAFAQEHVGAFATAAGSCLPGGR